MSDIPSPGIELNRMVSRIMGDAVIIPYSNTPYSLDVFEWMNQRGHVHLSDGDGDSFDCDWIPYAMFDEYDAAYARTMYGVNCETFSHAICIALLIGVREIDVKE